MKLKIWKTILALQLIVIVSCAPDVKEYRAIKTKIQSLENKAVSEEISFEEAAEEITALQNQLAGFDTEVIKQYRKEEMLKSEIEKKQAELKEKKRIDSIQKAKEKRKKIEETERKRKIKQKRKKDSLKREVGKMIRLEEKANHNLYLKKLKENGLFLISFSTKRYEINKNQWNAWKNKNNPSYTKAIEEARMLRATLPSDKLQSITTSMYRTLSNKMRQDKISMKTVEGIQLYDILRTGEVKFQ